MKTSLFEAAPEDILRLIFKASSKIDLVRLSMINKRFKELLEPQIYHTIDWVWGKDSMPAMTLLLRTILARPELATFIRNIVAVVKESEVPISGLWIDMLGGGTDPISINASPHASPHGQQTRLATMDAVLAVLLSRLPNLTSLHLGPNFTKETTILSGMFKHALCSENVFGRSNFEMLKEVYFSPRICIEKRWGRNGNDQKPDNSLCPLTFFSAPAIEHITATVEEPETFKWPGNPPSPSTLTSLDITLLREGTLGNILSRCSNLHTLAYHFYADKASGRSHDRVQRSLTPILVDDRLMSSLTFVENRLKSLVLTAYITPNDYDGHEAEPESIDTPISFRGSFSQLEKLEIPIVFLLGYEPSDNIKLGDVLPKNVRSVTLTDDTWWKWQTGWSEPGEIQLLDVFEEWFDNCREYTPQLEKVRVLISEMDPWSPEAVQRLENIGVNNGLEIEHEEIYTGLDRFWPRVGYLEG